MAAETPSRLRTHPDFVGREAELTWLERGLQEAIAGRPQLTIVFGEVGVGKTRLHREVRQRAQRAHMGIGLSRGDENMALPYRVLGSAVEPLLDDLADESPERVETTRRILGIRGPGSAPHAPEAGSHNEAERAEAFRAVESCVIDLARKRPLLLCLDDLHWSDSGSLELLLRIARAVEERATTKPVPLMILCGSRPVAAEHPHASAFAGLQREPICTVLELEGLRVPEVATLLERSVGSAPKRLVEEIHRLTRGNPLYVREVCHVLQSRAGGAALGPGVMEAIELPSSLRTAVAGRAKLLAPEVRGILRLAACLGERFSLTQLVALSGRERSELLDMLDACEREGLLVFEGKDIAFAHPLLRRTCYQELSHLERCRSHLRIANALLKADDGEEKSAEIASHLLRAGTLADPAQLAQQARFAGDRALASYASGDAARFYEAVLDALPQGSSAAEAAELHMLAGTGYYREGDAARAVGHFDRAAEVYESVQSVGGAARAQLERMRVRITLEPLPLGAHVDAGPLEAALDALPESEERLRGRILSVLAGVHWISREPDTSIAYARRAIEIGERIGDLHLQSEAYSALSASELQNLALADALRSNEEGLRCAREVGDGLLESMALCRLPLVHAWSGQLAAAEEAARESEQIVRLTHDWAGRSLALAGHLASAVVRGRFDEAEELGAETLRTAERSGYPWGAVSGLPAVAWSRLMRGDPHGAEAALARLDEPGYLFPEPGPMIKLLLWIYRIRIRVHPALVGPERDALSNALRAAPTGDTVEVGGLGGYGAAIEIADVLGEPEMVRAPRAVIERAARGGVVMATGWTFLVPRILGIASALAGDEERAERELLRAVDLACQFEARAELALAYLDLARTERARVGAGDSERVAEFAERALDVANEIGMDAVSRRAVELGSQEGPSQPAREAPITGHWLRTFLARAGRGETSIAVTASAFRGEPRSECVILMTDMVGSTPLLEELGAAGALAVMHEHNEIVRSALADFQGTEIQHTGDGIFAFFVSGARAVACAREIQRRLVQRAARGGGSSIRVRIGLASGPVLHEEGRLFGAPVVVAARLCAAAQGGQVLVSDEARSAAGTEQAFRDLGRIRLAGFREPLHVHEAV
jgi:class 3 adenylate cyclase/tetratricopeptide (TPR) repeat protein